MQTNPLYVSQLARHIKLPLIKTVQDHTEELFRHRTNWTLNEPTLNSTSATQLHVRVEELLLWALYLRHYSSLSGREVPREVETEAVEVGALMGMVTSTSRCPGASWHPHGRLCSLSPLQVQRWPVWISCAGTTDSTFSGRKPWVQWNPPRSENCWLLIPSASPTTQSGISPTLQNCAHETSMNNAAPREHFQCYQHSKAMLHLVFQGFFSTPIALGKYMLFVADIKNPFFFNIYIYIFFFGKHREPPPLKSQLAYGILISLSYKQCKLVQF